MNQIHLMISAIIPTIYRYMLVKIIPDVESKLSIAVIMGAGRFH